MWGSVDADALEWCSIVMRIFLAAVFFCALTAQSGCTSTTGVESRGGTVSDRQSGYRGAVSGVKISIAELVSARRASVRWTAQIRICSGLNIHWYRGFWLSTAFNADLKGTRSHLSSMQLQNLYGRELDRTWPVRGVECRSIGRILRRVARAYRNMQPSFKNEPTAAFLYARARSNNKKSAVKRRVVRRANKTGIRPKGAAADQWQRSGRRTNIPDSALD